MTTIIWIVIGTMIGIGSPWLIRHRHRLIAEFSRGSMLSGRRRSAVISSKSDYECVMIRPCLEGCAAVTEQKKCLYSADQVPELPLPGCDTRKCSCRYQYRKDRRDNEDRRFELTQFNAMEARVGLHEKRSSAKGDRRKSTKKSAPRAYFNDY
jgi:hypothetical protein